jgi:Mn2+/Fe2+ NRAMP family transporter
MLARNLKDSITQIPDQTAPPRGWAVSIPWARNLLTFVMVFGPGLIVMEADNDAGAVSTYVQAGAQYGTHLLWTLIVLLPMTYFVQEMVVRLGIATRAGPRRDDLPTLWKLVGRFSLFDLLLINFLTLVTPSGVFRRRLTPARDHD